MSVELGDKAPDFTLPTDGNGNVTLSKLSGKKVVLYFYPKDDTSGCTAEACGFRDSFPDYGGTGAVVIGVSKDSVASHDKFKKKHDLPFILASDAGGDVCEKYGVWVEKSMYGRKYMGIERATFLIDKDGGGARRLAQGQGAGPRRRSAEGGARPLTRHSLQNSDRRGGGDPCHRRSGGQGRGEPGAGRGVERRRHGARRARAAAAPGPAGTPVAAPAKGHAEAPGIRLASRPDRAAACARPYRAQRDRPRLGPRRAVRRRRDCRARSSTTGSASPPRRPSISRCCRPGSPSSAPATAICRRMTGCGKPRLRRPMTCSHASRSCRWCSKRADST